ncbi:hypothetical protein GCM10010168_16530 [Actinoplanes ianthinogenes]|uniref:YbaB/EbfC DNA-binding family protein n=1 Tax=Actinoplanes ianthinogenes TaxID=122358 RepID=A0ABM7LZV5_9ACTN|nr:YbaB/EbfC family nucleoid-associated protein [Actinoplanes ianthinogenes]BCJ44840.1 hypothetical protein Aiant_54970 [Actinoplanes ianthinogenes]GGR00305.1 hypothetical protein GCM10010168_16530 [Actinoplanes ianthinogenes]
MQPEAFRQLQQRVEALGRLAQELGAATPQWSEGSDPTGWVHVVLGPNGLPAEIRVRDKWQQRLEPEQLGVAVMEAHREAVRQAMRVLTRRLDDTHWWSRERDLDEYPEDFLGQSSPATSPSPLSGGRVHNDVEYGEDVLKALQAVQRRADEVPPATKGAEGRDDGRHVVVRLGVGGMTGCEIEPRWARNCDGTRISTALAVALKRAKSEIDAPETNAGSDVDTLLSDALATLTAFTDQHQRPGGMR